ncbi:MAG: hypothetical protein HQK63_02930 [Desulfamplus sp.]|nr:hypothetical protein [Desulfamplus sp.]
MILKDNLNITYDLSGNLILTIPKFYINNIDQNILLKSVERLIRSATDKITISSNGWQGDSAADIVGICKSDVNDGSVSHDNYIYGLE